MVAGITSARGAQRGKSDAMAIALAVTAVITIAAAVTPRELLKVSLLWMVQPPLPLLRRRWRLSGRRHRHALRRRHRCPEPKSRRGGGRCDFLPRVRRPACKVLRSIRRPRRPSASGKSLIPIPVCRLRGRPPAVVASRRMRCGLTLCPPSCGALCRPDAADPGLRGSDRTDRVP